jgi:hypothetical protein
MKIYKVTKESPKANSVVAELNANVFTMTFQGNTVGKQFADFYKTKRGANILVAVDTFEPVNATFSGTVLIEF